jgi:hypothetical protein
MNSGTTKISANMPNRFESGCSGFACAPGFHPLPQGNHSVDSEGNWQFITEPQYCPGDSKRLLPPPPSCASTYTANIHRRTTNHGNESKIPPSISRRPSPSSFAWKQHFRKTDKATTPLQIHYAPSKGDSFHQS